VHFFVGGRLPLKGTLFKVKMLKIRYCERETRKEGDNKGDMALLVEQNRSDGTWGSSEINGAHA